MRYVSFLVCNKILNVKVLACKGQCCISIVPFFLFVPLTIKVHCIYFIVK